jgi:hypothetical protein
MDIRNFSVKVIQGPHRERSFALDRIYEQHGGERGLVTVGVHQVNYRQNCGRF